MKLSGPTDQLPVTQFTWGPDAIGLGATVSGPTTAEYASALYGDIDNDGDTDVFLSNLAGQKVMMAEPAGGYCCTYTTPQPINVGGSWMGRATMELNGDGLIDFIGWKNNGGLNNFTSFAIPPLPSGVEMTDVVRVADFNGDGLDELYVLAWLPNTPNDARTLFVWMNESGVLAGPVPAEISGDIAFGDIQQVKLADFDGDGRHDLLVRQAGFVWRAWRSDSNLTGIAFTDYGHSDVSGGHIGELALTADVNGDGLTDVVILGGSVVQPGTVRVAISKGKHGSAAADSLFANTVPTDITSAMAWLFRVMDVDGDGRDDILAPPSSGPAPHCTSTSGWCAWRSDGQAYPLANLESIGGPAPGSGGLQTPAQIAVVDINGDGHRDFLLTTTTGGAWQYRLHAGQPANLVTNISDGLGNTNGITYIPLSQVENSGTVVGPQSVLVRDGRPVVFSYTSPNGLGGTYGTNYTYTGGLRDRWGRGFLGFQKIKITDGRLNNPDVETEYQRLFPYTGLVDKQTLLRPGTSTPIRITDPTWSQYATDPDGNPATPNPHAVYVEQEQTDEYEVDVNNSLYLTTNRSVYWNATHNSPEVITVNVTSPQQAVVTYTSLTTNVFDSGPASTGVWCLGLVTSQSVLRVNATGSEPRASSASWDQTTCAQLSETVGTTGPAAEQLKTTYTHDNFGRVQWVTLDNGGGTLAQVNQHRSTQFTYLDGSEDARPFQEKAYIQGQDPHIVERTWHAGFGLMLSELDVQEQLTSWAYDDFGRPKTESLPTGVATTMTYADCAIQGAGCFALNAKYRVYQSSTNGFWSQTDFDSLGRSVGEANVLGDDRVSRSQVTYNSLGQVVGATVPAIGAVSGVESTSTHDLLGRLDTHVSPVEVGTSSVAQARDGLTVTTTDGRGKNTARSFNPDGTLNDVTDALGKTTAYQYTPFGELKKITDSGGHVTDLTHDARGFQRTLDDPDSTGLWTTEYTAFGEVWRTRDPKTAPGTWTMIMTHDQLGRPVQRQEAEGVTTWNYYADNLASEKRKGLLYRATGPLEGSPGGFQETYLYNNQALVKQTATSLQGAAVFYTDMLYNQGQLSSMTYPLSVSNVRHTFTWQYNNGYTARLDQADAGLPAIAIWTLVDSDALGRAAHVRFGTGTAVFDEERVFDPRSMRLTAIQTGPGADIQNYGYLWDNAGNLTQRQNLATGGKTEIFAYDDLNRLDVVTLNGSQTLNINYDDGTGGTPGNIAYKSDYGNYAYGDWGAGPRAVTNVTGGPESMTYHYNVNGNMDCRGWNIPAESCTPSSTADEIQWTSFNLPKRIEHLSAYSTLAYGPDRQVIKQVSSSSEVRSIYTVGPHFEYEISAGVGRSRHTAYVDGQAVYLQVDERTATEHYGSTLNYYAYFVHHDHQGSWDALTSAWGSGGDIPYSYDAFGKRRESNWTADVDESQLYNTTHMSRRGYTGHEHLDNVGMIHMNGRVQDPILGRMTSRDPVLGDIYNPETLNRYAYVTNNPSTLTDPTGFAGCINDGSPNSWCWHDERFDYSDLSESISGAIDAGIDASGGLAVSVPNFSVGPLSLNGLAGEGEESRGGDRPVDPVVAGTRRGRDRGKAGKPTGTPSPGKKYRWDEKRQRWYLNDPDTGKPKLKPPGFDPPPGTKRPPGSPGGPPPVPGPRGTGKGGGTGGVGGLGGVGGGITIWGICFLCSIYEEAISPPPPDA